MRRQVESGFAKGMTLLAPRGDETRPTSGKVRAAVFDILQADIDDATCLDLFAGSGAMGIEAISRGASACLFVETAGAAIAVMRKNIEELERRRQVQQLTPFKAEVARIDGLKGPGRDYADWRFEIIYMDPPYDMAKEAIPAALKVWGSSAGEGAIAVGETRKGTEFEEIPGWALVKNRVYGDTMVWVWKRVKVG